MRELGNEDRFQLKLERIEGAVSNGICYMCDEEIDFTDDNYYILFRARINRPTERFHLNCFEYMVYGMQKFVTVVIEQRKEVPVQ